MTAAAMIVGMIPMAIGGAGEEQNAALARAVIGGLLFATPTTLLIVPYLFAMLRKRQRRQVGAWCIRREHRMNDIEPLDRPRAPATDRATPSRRRKSPAYRADKRADGGAGCSGSVCCSSSPRRSLSAHRATIHSIARSIAASEQRRDFVPSVRVAAVRASDGNVLVTLPATTSAFAAANIYARASGYIDKRNVDIGDRVKEGQLLAQITAPELDHQIAQAAGHARPAQGSGAASAGE